MWKRLLRSNIRHKAANVQPFAAFLSATGRGLWTLAECGRPAGRLVENQQRRLREAERIEGIEVLMEYRKFPQGYALRLDPGEEIDRKLSDTVGLNLLEFKA